MLLFLLTTTLATIKGTLKENVLIIEGDENLTSNNFLNAINAISDFKKESVKEIHIKGSIHTIINLPTFSGYSSLGGFKLENVHIIENGCFNLDQICTYDLGEAMEVIGQNFRTNTDSGVKLHIGPNVREIHPQTIKAILTISVDERNAHYTAADDRTLLNKTNSQIIGITKSDVSDPKYPYRAPTTTGPLHHEGVAPPPGFALN